MAASNQSNNLGAVIAVKTSAQGLATSDWAKSGRDNQNSYYSTPKNGVYRLVRFMGSVVNEFIPSMNLTYANVEILNSNGQLLCQTRTTYDTGQFECTAMLNETVGMTATARVTSNYGVQAVPIQVPSGAANSLSVVNSPIELPLSTLQLSGYVRDGSGNGIANAKIDFSGGYVYDTTKSNTSGYYEKRIALPEAIANSTEVSFDIITTDGLNGERRAVTMPILMNQISSQTNDFELDKTKLGSAKRVFDNVNTAITIAPDGSWYAGNSNEVVAFDANGLERWRKPVGGYVTSIVMGEQNRLYVGFVGYDGHSSIGVVTALSLSGTVLWSQTMSNGSYQMTMAMGVNGALVVYDGREVKSFTRDGFEQWQQVVTNGSFKSLSVASNGNIFVSIQTYSNMPSCTVDAFDSSGTSLWQKQLLGACGVDVVIGENDQFYMTSGSVLYAFSSTGQQQWALDLVQDYLSNLVILPDGSIRVAGEKLLTVSSTGNLLTESVLPNVGGSLVLASNGTTYLVAGGNLLSVAQDGVIQWQFTAGNSSVYAPAISPDGTVLVVTNNMQILAINAGNAGLADTYWAKSGRDSQNTARSTGLTLYAAAQTIVDAFSIKLIIPKTQLESKKDSYLKANVHTFGGVYNRKGLYLEDK
jgi:hypothetical protein